MRRQSLHALLGALVLVLVLSACGGSSGSTAVSTASSPVTSSAAASAALGEGQSKRSPRPQRASHLARRVKPKPRGTTVLTYGTEASPAQRSRAARALRGYLEARAKGEWSAACSYLAVPARRQVEALTATSGRGKGCPAAYAALYAAAPASQRADPFTGLTALRLKGRHGSAVFLSSSGAGYVMPMLSEGGSWRPTQISPCPLSPRISGLAWWERAQITRGRLTTAARGPGELTRSRRRRRRSVLALAVGIMHEHEFVNFWSGIV